MRQLSKLEKKVIAHICSIKSLSTGVAICDIITKFCPCSLQWDDNSVMVFFDNNKYSTDYILDKLLTVICLFEYLQSESLIYVFKRTNVEDRKELINQRLNHSKFDNNTFNEEREIPIEHGSKITISGKTYFLGERATGLSPLSKTNIPWNVALLVDRYANSVLFCTETLRHIKKRFYKDNATVTTWIAIFISVIIGVLGILGTYLSFFQNERHYKESMTNEQKCVVIRDTIIEQPSLIHRSTDNDSISSNSKTKMDLIRQTHNDTTGGYLQHKTSNV